MDLRSSLPGVGVNRGQRKGRPLWLWPVVTGVAAYVAGSLLVEVDVQESGWLSRFTRDVDIDAASAITQVVAGSAITVTTLTFSLTVLSLQLASQQFSPRLLREFTRDPITRLVLAVLSGTFVLALTVLHNLHVGEQAPAVAVLAVFATGLITLAAVMGFIAHIAQILRVDTMMRQVHDETSTVMGRLYPAYDEERGPSPVAPPGEGVLVRAAASGFIRLVDAPRLVATAADRDAFVRLEVRPGDLVVRGNPVATWWSRGGGPPAEADLDRLTEAVHSSVRLEFERTMEQDVAYGFRQLTDIAVKAISPSVNDPVTAVHALGHLSDLTVQLLDRRLGSALRTDEEGTGRVLLADRDLQYHLDLVCAPIRRYGAAEPAVLVGLLRLLRDAAVAARDDDQRQEVARQARLVVESLSTDLLDEDRAPVLDLYRRVELALAGDDLTAYVDRSGETRSV